MSLLKKSLLLICFTVYALGLYKLVQIFVVRFPYFEWHAFPLPGEDSIPFLPLLVIFYGFAYIMPAWLTVVITREVRLRKIFTVYSLLTLIHMVFFILLPVKYVLRPDIIIDSVMSGFVDVLYTLDAPLNSFPSMHVSFAFVTYFFIAKYKPSLKRVFLMLALATSISTLFVKQHYILDVAGGFLLAAFINNMLIKKDIMEIT